MKDIQEELILRAVEVSGFGAAVSRRKFLLLSAGAVTSLALLNVGCGWGEDSPLVITEHSKGLLVSDPSRCVGCLRCELACTEFNDGRAQPSLGRINVSRNLNFGPGSSSAFGSNGIWGNGLFIADTCLQCPHPVPCATACPENAVKADPVTGARFVDAASCSGCRMCQRACPYGMINFDEEKKKATKCFLCGGSPKCVEACPAGALRYADWRDLTRERPPRMAVLNTIAPQKAKGCTDCHPTSSGPVSR